METEKTFLLEGLERLLAPALGGSPLSFLVIFETI